MMRQLHELIKTIDVEPFQSGEGDLFRLRLEILRQCNSNIYKGNAYRLETYRLQPTFPQFNGSLPAWQNDGLIYVLDENFKNIDLCGYSEKEVIKKFENQIDKFFGKK